MQNRVPKRAIDLGITSGLGSIGNLNTILVLVFREGCVACTRFSFDQAGSLVVLREKKCGPIDDTASRSGAINRGLSEKLAQALPTLISQNIGSGRESEEHAGGDY